MPLNLASPGIVVREVDLTVGRIDPVSASVGALVAPFARGPVDLPTVIQNEADLLSVFGQPYSTDKHYEHWLTASSYLAYGGSLRVVRSDDQGLKNAFVGLSTLGIKIKSNENYNQLGYDENTITQVTFAAKDPGSWANEIKVAVIDARADQILSGINTNFAEVGFGFTQALSTVLPGVGTTTALNGFLKGVVTGITETTIETKITSFVSESGEETLVDYQPSGVYTLANNGLISLHVPGSSTPAITTSYTSQTDWFDQQKVELTNSTISWNNIVPRPATTSYAASRGSRFDEIHIAVIDDTGAITGNAGTILEKHIGLSKGSDAEFSVGSTSYWRKYLLNLSNYLYGGGEPDGTTAVSFNLNNQQNFELSTDIGWDQEISNIFFACIGSKTYTLSGGKNYSGSDNLNDPGSLFPGLDDIVSGYTLFGNTENFKVDFILMGSANYPKESAQALANKVISVAEQRKDAIAFISPHRQAFLNDTSVGTAIVNSDEQITNNVLSFYSPIASSTYAIFDSGYKFMYDRFNDTFRYVPLNGDIAGCCARNDINQFPWFSPAGTSRGTILNAVKLAYNPDKNQRDRLYSNRINPVIFSPGSGIVLFGDKTGFAKSSAFDRINVRRLFIYLEDAIAAAAKDQLFEFNDEVTRTNFVNIIEPFLRDVQSKRGIFDYVVICDETNNTAAVIDANEFVADIYIKPARSINFIGLTFIATRTGVAFEEVIGNV
jgi:hypothetical protein